MNKSFYFQHDYNSANDHKILFLRQQFGIEGFGIFWYVIEQLAQNNGRLPLKIVPVIAMQIQTTADKVNAVIRNYELFEIQDECFFSLRLLKQIEFRNELSEFGKRGGLKSGEIRKIKAVVEAPLEAPLEQRKGKERKGEKGNKENLFIYGTGDKFFTVTKKYITDKAYRVNGVDGLNEYMEANQSILNYPQFAEKFMRKYNGAQFNDFMHVFNSYNKFTDNA